MNITFYLLLIAFVFADQFNSSHPITGNKMFKFSLVVARLIKNTV